MRSEGVLGPRARNFATQIAHEGNPAHADLAAFAEKHGYEVAYDGLVLTISTPGKRKLFLLLPCRPH
jgi:hypothetical protein